MAEMEAKYDVSIKSDISESLPVLAKTDKVSSKKKRKIAFTEVVRNKKDREMLKGTSCPECKAFYDSLVGNGYTAEESKSLMNSCSRHRHKYLPPPTPDNYWSLFTLTTQVSQDQSQSREHKVGFT